MAQHNEEIVESAKPSGTGCVECLGNVAGGCICVAAPLAGISDPATARLASTLESIFVIRSTPSSRASTRMKPGSTTSKRRGPSAVRRSWTALASAEPVRTWPHGARPSDWEEQLH
jgi:hypothetical protein